MRTIQSPELFCIRESAERYGATQEWYQTEWQRRAGCGPTVCAHLMWYLSRTQPGCGALCPHDGSCRRGFLALMENVWNFVTPGPMGVNREDVFARGAALYGHKQGVRLRSRILKVRGAARPSVESASRFLFTAIADNLPVAFLNLSHGNQTHLESWHWVTVVGYDADADSMLIYDQGKSLRAQLGGWLKSTRLGGGFVALERDNT